MVRLILGRAGAGKTARILRELAARVAAGQGENVLLVPEQYSHEAERELCRAAGDSLSLYGEVLSFTGLARGLFSRCGGAPRVMDRGGRLLCMAWALEHLPPEQLRLYRQGRRDARTADNLVDTVDELRRSGAEAERLLATAAADPESLLGQKLRELALIMEAYRTALSRSAATPADLAEALAARLEEDGEMLSTAAARTYFVDGFSDFTCSESRVIAALIRAGAELTVCLTCDPGAGEGLFSLTAGTARFLRETAAEAGQELSVEVSEPAGPAAPIRYLCEHLFDFSPGEAPAADGSLRLVTAADPWEECELAAAAMAEKARGGARWRDMAVAVRGFADYRTALESACARYEVPLFLSGRGDTLLKSVPLFLSCALEAVNHGYEYEAMFGLLKTGLGPVTLAECDALENYAVVWNLRGSQWSRPFVRHPGGYNQDPDPASAELLTRLNELRERIMPPLLQLERDMGRARDARGQAQALAEYLERVDLPGRLAARARELEAAGRLETAAECRQLWEITCRALEQFAAVLGDTPMDGPRFQELFCRMLSKYDTGIIPVSLDRVQAGDFDGMRRRHIKHLFVLGARDGRLPAPEGHTGIFTPEERGELQARGYALEGPEELLYREFWRIYSCLSLPSETLWLSWPRADTDGQVRPSMPAERAMALFGIAPERGNILRARTFSREAAFTLAVLGQAGSPAPECTAARALFCQEGRGEELRDLLRTARAGTGRLGAEGVRRLYGPRPAITATRAQKFRDCPFAFFMRYGLKTRPRQRAVFDARDNGTFMHYILERTTADVMARGGFRAVSEEDTTAIARQYMEAYIHRQLGDFSDATERFRRLFRRMSRSVDHVVQKLREEMLVSEFQPLALELDLASEEVLAPPGPGGEELRLFGRIDRVDGWEHDGALYLRVVDYKTGSREFRLGDVCEGMNMQMLLYLFALTGRGERYFSPEGQYPAGLRPAGVLYSQARFRLLRLDGSDSDRKAARERMEGGAEKLPRSGLLLEDPAVLEAMEPGEEKRFLPVKVKWSDGTPVYSGQLAKLEDFGALSRFIDKSLHDMAEELRSGSMAPAPWQDNSLSNACQYCEYTGACLFDRSSGPWRQREHLSTEEAWKRIRGTYQGEEERDG